MRRSQHTQYVHLQGVGVLKLIHDDVGVDFLEPDSDPRLPLEKRPNRQEEIVEVDGVLRL